MLNKPLTGRGATVRVLLGVDPPLWLGYTRQYLVTLLPAVQHLMALELSLDVLAPLVSCTVASVPPPPAPRPATS